MVHELSQRADGRYEYAAASYVKPWHGLGYEHDGAMTVWQAIQFAGLDWKVEARPLLYNVGTTLVGDGAEVPDKVANVRSDTGAYLGTVGTNYTPIQNSEQADFIEELTGTGEAVVESVGAIFDGRQTFWSLKVPGNLQLNAKNGEDVIERYLVLCNGHDGSMSFRAFWSPIRVVCNNTLNFARARGEKEGICLRHTRGVKQHVSEARRVLELADAYYSDVAEEFQRFAEIEISDMMADVYFDELWPDPKEGNSTRAKNVRDQFAKNFHSGRGAEVAGSTVWGAYNAVTEYVDHQRTVRGATSDRDSGERRFHTVLLGNGRQVQQKAFDEARKLADALS